MAPTSSHMLDKFSQVVEREEVESTWHGIVDNKVGVEMIIT